MNSEGKNDWDETQKERIIALLCFNITVSEKKKSCMIGKINA